MSSLEQIRQSRLKKIERLRKLGISPYLSGSHRNTLAGEIVSAFNKYEWKEVIVAGRLMSIREHGAIIFGDLQDGSGKIQLYLKPESKLVTDPKKGTLGSDNLNLLDIGDIIEVAGIVTKTRRGEISVAPNSLRILAKSLRPLPEKWEGLHDPEALVRRRYLDLIMNPEKRWRFEKTADITFAVREFLNQRGYKEIKTPILQSIYGGTSARPFKTHAHFLDVDFYLAISHELYLKRLITAGFENVYNLLGYFRNEGIDRTHNPEFTMIETMSAYHNYEYNMNLTEELYRYIGEKVFGKTKFRAAGQEIDFAKPWQKISMLEAVKKYAGFDFDRIKTFKEAHQALAKVGYMGNKPATAGECLSIIFEEKVVSKLIKPTFVIGHPVEVSPLAKEMESDSRFAERFEIFIGGVEGGDNWTEQNDPVKLLERWKSQPHYDKEGLEKNQPLDWEFIEMLEYAMPPTTGLGPGIERLAMIFTETNRIDDVIFFPMLKPAPITELERKLYALTSEKKKRTPRKKKK